MDQNANAAICFFRSRNARQVRQPYVARFGPLGRYTCVPKAWLVGGPMTRVEETHVAMRCVVFTSDHGEVPSFTVHWPACKPCQNPIGCFCCWSKCPSRPMVFRHGLEFAGRVPDGYGPNMGITELYVTGKRICGWDLCSDGPRRS